MEDRHLDLRSLEWGAAVFAALLVSACFEDTPLGPSGPEPIDAAGHRHRLLADMPEDLESPAPYDPDAMAAMTSDERVTYVVELRTWSQWTSLKLISEALDLMGPSVPCQRANQAITEHLETERAVYARALIQWVEASATLDDDERARALEFDQGDELSQTLRRAHGESTQVTRAFHRRCRGQTHEIERRLQNILEDIREARRLARTGRRVAGPSQ